jgi:hypothetical protein
MPFGITGFERRNTLHHRVGFLGTAGDECDPGKQASSAPHAAYYSSGVTTR